MRPTESQAFSPKCPRTLRNRILQIAGKPTLTVAFQTSSRLTSYDDGSQNFADKLELNFVGGKLRLDNVDYGKGGDLKSALAAAFKN